MGAKYILQDFVGTLFIYVEHKKKRYMLHSEI